MMTKKQFYTTGEVANLIGVRSYQISYAVSAGHIEGASMTFMHKKMFTESDIERLKAYFENKRKEKKNEI